MKFYNLIKSTGHKATYQKIRLFGNLGLDILASALASVFAIEITIRFKSFFSILYILNIKSAIKLLKIFRNFKEGFLAKTVSENLSGGVRF